MNIIALAYFYPPMGSSGAIRNGKLLGWIAKLGHDVHVHTVKSRDLSGAAAGIDGVRVYRTSCFFPVKVLLALKKGLTSNRGVASPKPSENLSSRAFDKTLPRSNYQAFKDFATDLLTTPDKEAFWLLFCFISVIRQHRRDEVDIIYAVGKPWVALITGALLSRVLRRPLIIDFMDPWTTNPGNNRKAAILELIERKLEAWTLRQAKWIIANTDELREDLLTRHPAISDKVGVITCGYDPADFELAVPISGGPRENECLTITHAGSLYRMRNPVELISAVVELVESGRIKACDINVQLIGDLVIGTEELRTAITRATELGVLQRYARMPYEQALQMINSADVAIIVQPITMLQIPAKLYEYVVANKPMFAICEPHSAVDRIVKEHNWGISVPNNATAISQQILAIVNRFKAGVALAEYDPEVVEKYSYRNLAIEFIRQVNRVV